MIKGGKYLVIGDSTTSYTLSGSYNDGMLLYSHKLAQWIRDNYGGVQMIHKGVSGATTNSLMTWNRWLLLNDNIDIATIGIGVNDAYQGVTIPTIQANLEKVINRLTKKNPQIKIFLLTPSRVTSGANPNGNMLDTANDPIRALYDTIAGEYTNVFAIHTENAWTAGQTATNTADGLHPNAAGHGAIFSVLQPIVQTNASNWLNMLGK